MSTAAIEPPGSPKPINNKRKADDVDLDPHADASRLGGPIKVIEVAPGGDVLLKVRKAGRDDYVGGGNGNIEYDQDEGGDNKPSDEENSDSEVGGDGEYHFDSDEFGDEETDIDLTDDEEAGGTGSGREDEGNIEPEDDDEADAIDIIVSSKVLCSKSGMFKRMLEGPFTEAQTKMIQIEEDHPTVFLGFCEILHDAFDNSTPIDRNWFVEFLKIVDMRDAVRGVKSWVKDRLHKHFQRIDILAKQPWSQRQFRLEYPFRGIRNGIRHITMTDMMITAAVFRFINIFLKTSRLCLTSICIGGDKQDADSIWDNLPACINGKKLKRRCIIFLNLFWSVTDFTREVVESCKIPNERH